MKFLGVILFSFIAFGAMAQHSRKTNKVLLLPAKVFQKRTVNGINNNELIKVENAQLRDGRNESKNKAELSKEQAQINKVFYRKKQASRPGN